MPLAENGKKMSFNKENIIAFLNDDLALKNVNSDLLQNLVTQNPYSGVLQLLYCKHLHLNNAVEFESQLEKCSLVVADRKKVYELLFQPQVQKQIQAQETYFEEKESEIKEVVTSEEDTAIQLVEEKESIELAKNKALEKEKTLDELEENILVEAVNSSIQIDISSYSKENKKKEISDTPKSNDTVVEPEKERSFVNWFEKPKVRKVVKKETKKSIIDDFLKTTAHSRKNKVKKKEGVFSSTNVAKLSLVANNGFVTETLANIYAKQGQIEKAIEIYKQLSLKNPEKKTFFASRIRFLKEKQKYNN